MIVEENGWNEFLIELQEKKKLLDSSEKDVRNNFVSNAGLQSVQKYIFHVFKTK